MRFTLWLTSTHSIRRIPARTIWATLDLNQLKRDGHFGQCPCQLDRCADS
jgi:hypothetical protein